MDKIRCVISENGTIIPIHNICLIAGKKSSHYIWTNAAGDDYGHKLSDEQYNALLKNIEIIWW